MKFRGVQRSVKPQRFDRSAGDAPSLGRVGRVPGTGLPKKKKRRKRRVDGRSRTSKARSRSMVVWSVVLVMATLCAIGGAVWLWMKPNMIRGTAGAEEGEEFQEKRVVSRFDSPSELEALAVVKRGLAVRDSLLVGDYFRQGSASLEEVVGFLQGMEDVDGGITGYTWLSSMDANGQLIDGVLVASELEGNPRNRLAFLTPDEAGVWKVDFESFARIVKPSWDELLEKGAAEGMVRVVVAVDNYYNGPFIDDREWVCYGMASPDTEVVMFGYCRKGTAQHEAMKKIVSAADVQTEKAAAKRATLEIRRVEGAASRQFEILRVLAEDWVVTDVPFDGVLR